MRINEYPSLEEFIREYSFGRRSSDEFGEYHMGLEFKYKDSYFRMCREIITNEEAVLLDDKKAVYHVMIMKFTKHHYPIADEFVTVGWYADMNSLLNECTIMGKSFREIVSDDDTEILSKD